MLSESRDLSDVLPGVQLKPASQTRHWLALVSYCLNSCCCAFINVNFSVIQDQAQDAFGIDGSLTAWFYIGVMIVIICTMPIGLLIASRREFLAISLSAGLDVLATWGRWFSVQRRSFGLAMTTVVINGFAVSLFLCLPSQISQRFPRKRRPLTTSLATQANYLGWLTGAVVPPLLVTDNATMDKFFLGQAVTASVIMAAVLLLYRPELPITDQQAPRVAQSALSSSFSSSISDTKKHSFKDLFYLLIRCPRLMLETIAYGMLGGLSFAIPSCMDAILKPLGYTSRGTVLMNMAFLLPGIVGGLLLGAFCQNPDHYGKMLKSLFVTCAVCFITLATLKSGLHVFHGGWVDGAVLGVLIGIAGICSLSFIGLAIEAAVLHPVRAADMCFWVEYTLQIFGALLGFANLPDGFVMLAPISVAAACIFVFCFKLPEGVPLTPASMPIQCDSNQIVVED